MTKHFKLDTSDMERHRVELRMFLDKAKRRFEAAQMSDTFADLLRAHMPTLEGGQQAAGICEIHQINDTSCGKLRDFLIFLVEKCDSIEKHDQFDAALRDGLQKSRRKNIMADGNSNRQLEPLCFFCTQNLEPQAVGREVCSLPRQAITAHANWAPPVEQNTNQFITAGNEFINNSNGSTCANGVYQTNEQSARATSGSNAPIVDSDYSSESQTYVTQTNGYVSYDFPRLNPVTPSPSTREAPTPDVAFAAPNCDLTGPQVEPQSAPQVEPEVEPTYHLMQVVKQSNSQQQAQKQFTLGKNDQSTILHRRQLQAARVEAANSAPSVAPPTTPPLDENNRAPARQADVANGRQDKTNASTTNLQQQQQQPPAQRQQSEPLDLGSVERVSTPYDIGWCPAKATGESAVVPPSPNAHLEDDETDEHIDVESFNTPNSLSREEADDLRNFFLDSAKAASNENGDSQPPRSSTPISVTNDDDDANSTTGNLQIDEEAAEASNQSQSSSDTSDSNFEPENKKANLRLCNRINIAPTRRPLTRNTKKRLDRSRPPPLAKPATTLAPATPNRPSSVGSKYDKFATQVFKPEFFRKHLFDKSSPYNRAAHKQLKSPMGPSQLAGGDARVSFASANGSSRIGRQPSRK